MLPVRRRARYTLLVGALAALPVIAQPTVSQPSVIARSEEGMAWQPRAIRGPVALKDLQGHAPYVPDGVPQATGAMEVTSQKGAAVWLGPLDVVRVTGPAGALRFTRVPLSEGDEAPELRVEEEGVSERPGRWYLAEPMGAGSIWWVTATKNARIVVERPTHTSTARTEERMRDAILKWVDGKGPRPALAFDAATRARLDVDAALEAELVKDEPESSPFRTAVRDWRKAAALREWALVSPLYGQAVRVERPRPTGTEVVLEGMDAPWVRPEVKGSVWALELEGPGVFSLEARTVLGNGAPAEAPSVEVYGVGGVLAQAQLMPQPAWAEAPEGAALPDGRTARMLPSGERVGIVEEMRVALPPGKHNYRVSWKGPAPMLRARVATRRPTLSEALSHQTHWTELAEKAWEVVKQDTAARPSLLRQRLVSLMPDLARGTYGRIKTEGLSPLLRAMAALSDRETDAAVEALKDTDASPLAWHLRLLTAKQLLDAGKADVAHALLGTAPALPDAGFLTAEASELVARLPLGDPLRSRELAALELAWRAEPLSEDIRRGYRAAWWRSSRWSQVTPAPREDGTEVKASQWLDLQGMEADASMVGSALWPLAAGGTTHVQATGLAEAPTLLRAYVMTPPGAKVNPVLRVGSNAFPLLPLSAVEPVEIALPPGEHALKLEGVEGTRAFLSLAPAKAEGAPGEVGYVRSQWPANVDKKAVRFRVPDAKLPSPVRVQFRPLGAEAGKPFVVRMNTDVGHPRRLVLMPGAASARHVALEGAKGTSSAPVSAVVTLPAQAREVWFEPEDPKVQLAVSLAVRRAEVATPEESPAPPQPQQAGTAYETLQALSRTLRAEPLEMEPRLARAELLSSLQEDGFARADVGRLLDAQAKLTPEQQRRLLALMDRLSQASPRTVRFAQAITQPTLVSPAFPALDMNSARLPVTSTSAHDGSTDTQGNAALAGTSASARTGSTDTQGNAALAGTSASARDGSTDTQGNAALAGTSASARDVHTAAEGNTTLAAISAQVREGHTDAALAAVSGDKSLAGRYLRARLLSASGEDAAGALAMAALYRETGLPQVGLEALGMLERLQDSPQAWKDGGAPLGAALAGQLQAWADHPDVRRMRFTAGRWTRWEGLRDAEETAGSLVATSESGADDEDVAMSVRKALLAPPWKLSEAKLLPAGASRVMSLVVKQPRPLGAEVLCGTTPRPGVDAAGTCAFALRVDGRVVRELQVAEGDTAILGTRLDVPGRHQVEVVMARADTQQTGLVRFVESEEANANARVVAAPQPLSLLRSRPGAPVVMTVLGPTALRVRATALAPTAGRELLLRSTPLPSGDGTGGSSAEEGPLMHLGLPEDADPGLQGASQPLGRMGETWLLLPSRGPHRVSLESPAGEALVQVQLGVASDPSALAAPSWAQGTTGLEPLPWPALPPGLSLLPEGMPPEARTGGLGMVSAEMGYRSEDVEEGELLNRPLQTGLEVRLSLRRELSPGRAWLRFTPEARYPLNQTAVLGGTVAAYVNQLPGELRLSMQGSVFTQTLDGAMRWSARGRIAADRYLRLSPDVGLIPGLGLTLESMQGGSAVEASRYDQNVYWLYGKDHPRRLSPRLSLRWQPFQDHVATLGMSAVSNANIYTVDNAGAYASWAAHLGGKLQGTRVELGYGASQRFQDDHRATAYLRHRVSGRADWNVWMGKGGNRLMLFAEDRAFLSGPYGTQNVFSLGARWDWTGGRGLQDVTPTEEEFEELLDEQRLQP
ncbi:hypothetical protein [Corallococcus carmarthensis]|uniref:Uncharacterized protein n=1 Tax=Corallococcus carmarthensis TaxID=2316728 RepID=A0A3A8JW65_9BACT|nr:hypothetical protein [Corallococcus carmarthensis]RKG99166.1 hypothetical protein D7X32_27255 [Corallococcus carmarthensis]